MASTENASALSRTHRLYSRSLSVSHNKPIQIVVIDAIQMREAFCVVKKVTQFLEPVQAQTRCFMTQ